MIDPNIYGVSFSVKQCRNFGMDWQACLAWALSQGFRRFRLMSYWDEIQKSPHSYDFSVLDKQIAVIEKSGGIISLCLGVKQPRWPEYHWPNWTNNLEISQKDAALLKFVEITVARYKNRKSIISWQLENEALLSNFGKQIQIDRKRLKQEYTLVKQLDPGRQVCMSTSNGWGVPVRQPIPDIVGFSYYARIYSHGIYHSTIHKPWLYKIRAYLIDQLLDRPVFIHELQLEPWGPKAIWEMSSAEQGKSMSTGQIAKNLRAAQKIHAYPIDMWGVEWWYWRYKHGDASIWQAVQQNLA